MDQKERQDITNRVFEFWKVRTGHPRARLDEKRRQKIHQRLADGYTEQDLLDAIEGCAISPFHNGTQRRDSHERYSASTVYNDLELILRDAKHVDQFIQINDRHIAAVKQREAVERQRKAEEERERSERLERASSGFRSHAGLTLVRQRLN